MSATWSILIIVLGGILALTAGVIVDAVNTRQQPGETG